MTWPLSSGSPAPPGRHLKGATGRESARECRNQSITDFFKPAPKQDRIVLCSPEKRKVNNGDVELSVMCTERFEKKISSQKKTRRQKIPVQTPNKSPVIDLLRGAKREKRDSPNVLENNRACMMLSTKFPKVVVRKLPMSPGSPNYSLTKKDKTRKRDSGRNEICPIKTRTPLCYENGREKKIDRMDLETSSDSSKWISSSEADVLNYASSNGNVNNKPLCQKAGHSTKLQHSSVEPQFWLPLETYCREREQKLQRLEQPKLQPFTPVKAFSGTSISNQGNGCLLRKRSSSASCETASDESSRSKQVSKPQVSSPVLSRWSSEKAVNIMAKTGFSIIRLNSISSELLKPKDILGKRKRSSVSMDLKNSGKPVEQSLNEPLFSRSSEKCKNRKPEFIKHNVLESPDVLQPKGAATSPRENLQLSVEYLDINHKKQKDNSSYMDLSSLYSGHCANKNDQIYVANTKEDQLQVTHSHLLLEKSTSFSHDKATIKTYLHELSKPQSNAVYTEEMKCLHSSSQGQSASSPQVLETKKEQGRVRQTDSILCDADNIPLFSESHENCTTSEENTVQASKDHSNLPSMDVFETSVSAVKTGKAVARSLTFEDECSAHSPRSSQLSNELNIESCSITTSVLNRKLSHSSESEDETFDCNLDSDDDDEEMLLPLQDILSSSSKPHGGTPERACPKNLSQDTLTPSPTLPLSKRPVVSQVSYVNSLEHLLKEKEESKRVDDLEKQLQDDVQGIGLNSLVGEEGQEDFAEDKDLSEEHRAFIKRFSIVADAIPDYHPGEEIFHLSNSGKIFNQHSLDLRNSGFIPQNPIEKLLLRSEVTQQLSLTTQGFLSCAYNCTQCPIPVLKWLFQMMSVHSDYYVSTQILDTLMEITIKNVSVSDAQSRPWIPSLSDISAVFINMGVDFRSLFPLQQLQPSFREDAILSEMQTARKQINGSISAGPAFSCLPETNLLNVIKFLDFCITMSPDGYADQEILLLLLLLFKISLEKLLKQVPLVDLQCLLIKLLKNIRDWDAKMPQLCLTVSELSSHHHDLLWLVQLVPSWIKRGRQLRRCLSLRIISKLLKKKHTSIPDTSDLQMSLLYQYLVQMKPSDLLKKKMEEKVAEQGDLSGECVHIELEQQVYYLTYILLHLVSEVSCFDIVGSNQRKCLLKLCGALEKHVKCDIREDARLFYRTKVKDLVARIYGKWQEMIQNSRPTQGKLHDFWEPDL
uniref:SMC5-SMC6 complex localization factor 2 n=1 Tax=Pelusios castaneus TaxID=367368 RepID=A0A8C8RAJ2_9SAUR